MAKKMPVDQKAIRTTLFQKGNKAAAGNHGGRPKQLFELTRLELAKVFLQILEMPYGELEAEVERRDIPAAHAVLLSCVKKSYETGYYAQFDQMLSRLFGTIQEKGIADEYRSHTHHYSRELMLIKAKNIVALLEDKEKGLTSKEHQQPGEVINVPTAHEDTSSND